MMTSLIDLSNPEIYIEENNAHSPEADDADNQKLIPNGHLSNEL